jgi:cell wall-associated NlpC family hydrolase
MLQLLILLVCLNDPLSWKVTNKAIAFVGTPYRYGSASTSATDCSGLVQMIYKDVGIKLPRTAAEQYESCDVVPADSLQAGDLVFFSHTYKAGISHVGIYIGAGRFVHADRHEGVRVDSLSHPYYAQRLAGAGRPNSARKIVPPTAEPTVALVSN